MRALAETTGESPTCMDNLVAAPTSPMFGDNTSDAEDSNLRSGDAPSYGESPAEDCSMVQAADYFNTNHIPALALDACAANASETCVTASSSADDLVDSSTDQSSSLPSSGETSRTSSSGTSDMMFPTPETTYACNTEAQSQELSLRPANYQEASSKDLQDC